MAVEGLRGLPRYQVRAPRPDNRPKPPRPAPSVEGPGGRCEVVDVYEERPGEWQPGVTPDDVVKRQLGMGAIQRFRGTAGGDTFS